MALRYTWKMFERATKYVSLLLLIILLFSLAKVAKDADPDFKLNSYTKVGHVYSWS